MTRRLKKTNIKAFVNAATMTVWTTDGPVQNDIEELLGGIADFSTVAKDIAEMADQATVPVSVLVVDDEPDVVEEMTEHLSMKGFRSFGATSPRQALELVDREKSITIAVVDLKMPGMTGLELIHQLRQDPARDIQCIMVSGHGTMADVQQAMHQHVREFLTKPINSNEFIDSVARLGKEIAQRGGLSV